MEPRMFTAIPPEHDADLVLWRAQGVSLRDMAERLKERGVPASHMTVSRRLQAIQRAQHPARLESETLKSLSLNIDDLEEVEMRLRRIEELAVKGSQKHGRAPDIHLAYRAVTRRGELILSKHRVLQKALETGLGRESGKTVTGSVTPPVTGA